MIGRAARRREIAHNCGLKRALDSLYTSTDPDIQLVMHSKEHNWVFMLVRADTEMGRIFIGEAGTENVD